MASWRLDSNVCVTFETLASIPVFHNLTRGTLQLLAQEADIVQMNAGETIYQQRDLPTGLYTLLSGRVKLYRQSKERMQIFGLVLPGECFGAESLPEDAPSPYTAAAITNITAIYVPPDHVRQLLHDCPDFQVLFLTLVSNRLQQFVSLVHSLAFRDVSARLASVLLTLAKSDAEPVDGGLRMHRLLTQQELAAMVGTAREVVHRTFKKFEHDGLVRLTPTHIFILNADLLAELAKQETR